MYTLYFSLLLPPRRVLWVGARLAPVRCERCVFFRAGVGASSSSSDESKSPEQFARDVFLA
jgi:hypothetical protein